MIRTITADWEPITRDEAKAQIQGLEGISDFDTEIDSLIKVAREAAEEYTWRAIVQSTCVEKLNEFPSGKIVLPRPPVSAITSISYVDVNGENQTIPSTDYVLNSWVEPCYIVPASGKSWPASRGGEGDVVITYVAGFVSQAVVPVSIKHAVKMMVRTWFDQREDVTPRTVNQMPMGSKSLLHHWRCNRF